MSSKEVPQTKERSTKKTVLGQHLADLRRFLHPPSYLEKQKIARDEKIKYLLDLYPFLRARKKPYDINATSWIHGISLWQLNQSPVDEKEPDYCAEVPSEYCHLVGRRITSTRMNITLDMCYVLKILEEVESEGYENIEGVSAEDVLHQIQKLRQNIILLATSAPLSVNLNWDHPPVPNEQTDSEQEVVIMPLVDGKIDYKLSWHPQFREKYHQRPEELAADFSFLLSTFVTAYEQIFLICSKDLNLLTDEFGRKSTKKTLHELLADDVIASSQFVTNLHDLQAGKKKEKTKVHEGLPDLHRTILMRRDSNQDLLDEMTLN